MLELDGERVIWQPASSVVAPLPSEPLKYLSDNYIWALSWEEEIGSPQSSLNTTHSFLHLF